MGFTNEKIEPRSHVWSTLEIPIFDSVRSTIIKKSLRKRQCFWCGLKNIQKGENYVNHEFRYDGRIITISFHVECFK